MMVLYSECLMQKSVNDMNSECLKTRAALEDFVETGNWNNHLFHDYRDRWEEVHHFLGEWLGSVGNQNQPEVLFKDD